MFWKSKEEKQALRQKAVDAYVQGTKDRAELHIERHAQRHQKSLERHLDWGLTTNGDSVTLFFYCCDHGVVTLNFIPDSPSVFQCPSQEDREPSIITKRIRLYVNKIDGNYEASPYCLYVRIFGESATVADRPVAAIDEGHISTGYLDIGGVPDRIFEVHPDVGREIVAELGKLL